ncbi:MAG: phosphate/phosphite/phosphonate ABC transporter substrate-binding protein [Bullifex sp.]|nr:phosphate/phosphite/phosphonate ABC transporter substrate-binding protein [Spirochaetales bacterium]MDY5776776.1 phosphate/phosphite/phosphonate ABC transporter substrate-binding protein [Bullifex sp.]
MKKALTVLLICALTVTSVFAAGAKETAGSRDINKLSVYFVPSRDPETIVTQTAPLKQLLKDQLASQGWNVGEVVITVGTNYEAVGEALSAGTADIGLIPGATYVQYDDGAEVILTATRAGLSNDSDDPRVWNENEPTTATDRQAVGYRALFIAGPSAKGVELRNKVNNGEELTWEDLDSANWAVMGPTSSAGYVYPTILLQDKYGKGIRDLKHAVQADSYASAFARLASGQVDVLCVYADGRRDYESKWTAEFGRTMDIWTETDCIFVTPYIYNDTVSVSKTSRIMTPEFIEALQEAFIKIAETPEGKDVIAIYSHEGYQKAVSSDYNGARKAMELSRQN